MSSALQFGRQRSRRAINRQNQKRRRSTTGSACYAMMPGPGAILVLDAVEIVGNRPVPFLPFRSSLGRQGFANIHVTQKLFAAVRAESLDETVISKFLYDRGTSLRQISSVFLESIQGPFHLLA